MKLLLYCTKAKPYLTRNDLPNEKGEFYKHWQLGGELDKKHLYGDTPILNGKIVAECDFEVEKLFIKYGEGWQTDTIKGTENIEKLSCINREQLYQYCKSNGYAIHIKNLNIFDEPRELSDYKGNSKGNFFKIIEKAPQNMQMVLNEKLEDCILISIRPKWLCKILNGEKTIECRKKVLKEMLK